MYDKKGDQDEPVTALLHKTHPIDSMQKVFSELELLQLFLENLRDTLLAQHDDPWVDEAVIPLGLCVRHMERIIGQGYRIGKAEKLL